MSDWPAQDEQWGAGGVVINPFSPLSIGPGLRLGSVSVPASTAWPLANRAYFVPFRVPRICTAYQMSAGGGVGATGNVDFGLYDEWGNRLTSSGAASKVSSAEIIGNITDVQLLPGLYYMALAHDNTGALMAITPSIINAKLSGVKYMGSAYTLPNPATFATVVDTYIPMVSVWLKAA